MTLQDTSTPASGARRFAIRATANIPSWMSANSGASRASRTSRLGARIGAARRSTQRGVTILSVLLGLVVAGVVGMGIVERQALERRMEMGKTQGDLLVQISDAANMYIFENYAQLQNDQPITRNNITVAVGTNQGETNTPTVQTLIDLGYLREGITDLAAVNNGRYRMTLEKIPAGCVAGACDVHGAVYIDQPVTMHGVAGTDPDGVVIGNAVERIGGDALMTAVADHSQLLGVNGATIENPVAGDPYGVIGAHIGFGSGFSRFLVVGDTRDPNFQGDFTVAGDTNIGGDTIIQGNTTINENLNVGPDGTDPGGNACSLASILKSGEILTRTSDCLTRTWMNKEGNIGIASGDRATGNQTRVLLTGSAAEAGMSVNRNDGTQGAFIGYRAGDLYSQIFGSDATLTQVRTDTGGTYMTGTQVGGNTTNFNELNMRREANIGDACTMPQVDPNLRPGFNGNTDMPDATFDLKPLAIGHIGSKPVILTCDVATNTWQPLTGLTIGTVGGVCDTPGATGSTTDGVTLICSNNNTWVSMDDRLSKWSVKDSIQVQHNHLVAQPICPAGSKALIYEIPQVIDGTNFVSNFFARQEGSSWRISIVDGQFLPLPQAKAIAQTGCWFN